MIHSQSAASPTKNNSTTASRSGVPATTSTTPQAAQAAPPVAAVSTTPRSVAWDDDTVLRSGNPSTEPSSRQKKEMAQQQQKLENELKQVQEQLSQEKAGKRKLFHSLVKLANELRRTRNEAMPALETAAVRRKELVRGRSLAGPAGAARRHAAAATHRHTPQAPDARSHFPVGSLFQSGGRHRLHPRRSGRLASRAPSTAAPCSTLPSFGPSGARKPATAPALTRPICRPKWKPW